MQFTLGQASKECGKSKSTILRNIRNGNISATQSQNKEWNIEASELFRVFPRIEQNDETEGGNFLMESPNLEQQTKELSLENKKLSYELERSETERERERNRFMDELRHQREEISYLRHLLDEERADRRQRVIENNVSRKKDFFSFFRRKSGS